MTDDRRDFSRYDEQKEMIESVGLVKAKRGTLMLSLVPVLSLCGGRC